MGINSKQEMKVRRCSNSSWSSACFGFRGSSATARSFKFKRRSSWPCDCRGRSSWPHDGRSWPCELARQHRRLTQGEERRRAAIADLLAQRRLQRRDHIPKKI
eukprot:1278378-Rhodomonas_salina.2